MEKKQKAMILMYEKLEKKGVTFNGFVKMFSKFLFKYFLFKIVESCTQFGLRL